MVCAVWEKTLDLLQRLNLLGTPQDPPAGAGGGGWGMQCLGFSSQTPADESIYYIEKEP